MRRGGESLYNGPPLVGSDRGAYPRIRRPCSPLTDSMHPTHRLLTFTVAPAEPRESGDA